MRPVDRKPGEGADGGEAISVLLVEDSPSDAELALEALGATPGTRTAVRLVGRLSEALPAIAAERFDVVVLDLGLPDSDGLEALARIRAAAPQAAIVVRTGTEDEAVAVRALELGAQDHLVKGIGAPDSLPRAIRYALARRQADATSRGLAAIVESSHEAIVGSSLDGTITSWNSAAARMYGYSAEEAVGRPMSMLLGSEREAAEMRSVFEGIARGGPVEPLDTTRRRKDGSVIEVSLTASPIRGPGGQVVGVSTIARDVSEPRRLERQLRAIFDHAPAGMALRDLAGRYLQVNRRYGEIIGRSPEELLGGEAFELLSEEVAERLREVQSELLEHRQPVSWEMAFPHRDGSMRDYHLVTYPVLDESGEVSAIGAFAVDITPRLRAERDRDEAMEQLREAQGIARVGSWWWDPRTDRTRWSEEMYRALGLEPAGRPESVDSLLSHVHAEEREQVADGYSQLAGDGLPFEFEYRVTGGDGVERIVHALGRPDPSQPGCFIGTVQDVSELRAAHGARGAAEAQFRRAFEDAPIGIALVAVGGKILRANQALGEILGYPAEELQSLYVQGLSHPEDLAEDRVLALKLLRGELRSYQIERRSFRKDGRVVWLRLSVSLVRDAREEPSHFITQIEDVTEPRRAADALAQAERRFRVTVDHSPTGIALVQLAGHRPGSLIGANEAFCELLGRDENELRDMPLTHLVHADDVAAVAGRLASLADDEHARFEVEARCLHPEGRLVWVLLSGASVPAQRGWQRHAVIHALDIGERKRFEGQLQYLADHDALTGLFNRRRFEEELARAISHAERYDDGGAVLLIDLDGFKYVNDTMGHSYGDELVVRIAGLLRNSIRETDVVARLGGDEFAVILAEADVRAGMVVAEKILRQLRASAFAFADARRARVTASIGVTAFGPRTKLSAGELIVEADIAMYQAKDGGKNQAAAYERQTDHRRRLLGRESWLERVRTASEEGRFELMAQPIHGIGSGGIPRFELLLRMRGEEGELVAPGMFLYIAERFDLVQQIDRWVFGEAARLLHAHEASGYDISLSVNMSGKTLSDAGVLDDMARLLAAHPVQADRLIVEVTETAAIVNIEKARQIARGLRELGCNFALDDFGAGFASFYYLKHLDFDYLKIDGEFIKTLAHNDTDRLVVQSVVRIARALGAQTIAEFVGDQEALFALRELGVDYAQGYHLGCPKPVEEILPALAHA